MPNSQAPKMRRKKRRKKRSVFVIARPLNVAGPFAPLSDGKYPLCHWGLFLSEDDPFDVTSRWQKYRETKDPSFLSPSGTLFELVRDGWKNNYNKKDPFGFDMWDNEWGYLALVHVGETQATNEELSYEASSIIREHPDYNALTNNCQNFILYLLQFACKDYMAPTSISDVVIQDLNSSVQTIRNRSQLPISLTVVLFE